MKKVITRVVLILLVLGAVGAGYWYFRIRPQPAASAAMGAGTFTEIVQVTQGNLSSTISVVGELEAVQQSDIKFERLNGSTKLLSLEVKAGNTVKAGQTLATIDPVALSIFPGLFNVDACEFKNNTAYRCASFFQCFQETGPTYYSTFDIHHNTGTDIGSIDGTLNWGLQYNEGPDSTFWYLMPSGGHDQEFIGVQPIRNCNIYNNIATGGNHRFFYLHQNEGNIATGNKFYNNFCYNSRRPGLLFGTPEADSVLEDNYVYNNIIYNPGELAYGYMMNIGAPSGNDENSKNYFYNNVFILTSALDTMVNLDGAGYAGTVWRNNIFIGNGATVVYPRATLGWKDFDYNSYYGFGETMFMNYTWADFIGAQGQEAHSPNGATASVDPKLIGDGTYTSDTGDYKLQATSPCQGAGANLSATVTTDYFGTTRTVPLDIGAYEFLAGGTAWPSMGLGIGTKGGNMPPWIRKKK